MPAKKSPWKKGPKVKKMYTEKEYNKMKAKLQKQIKNNKEESMTRSINLKSEFSKMLTERDLKIRKYEAQLNKIKSMVFPIVPVLKATDKLNNKPLSYSHLFRGLEADEEKLNNYLEKTNLPRPDWWPASGEM